MDRTYDDGTNADDVNFFIGTEVEKSPMHGQKTLFVVGTQDPEVLVNKAMVNHCNHVYLGANMSFNLNMLTFEYAEYTKWCVMFDALKKADLWFTLDFQPHQIELVTDEGLGEYNKFIAMISVRVPYFDQLGYNACMKIDDKDFAASNDGVWVHRLHTLKDPSAFTHWSEYTDDNPI